MANVITQEWDFIESLGKKIFGFIYLYMQKNNIKT